MLETYIPEIEMTEEEIKNAIRFHRKKLEEQQLLIKEHKLPVMVLFEGWGAAGKGSAIGKVIRNIDPRFFSVVVMRSTPTEDEKRKPFLHRFFNVIPEAGKFAFLDSGWMDAVMREKMYKPLTHEEYEGCVDSIKMYERQLTDNGYLLVKLFFHISEKEQRKRIRKLSSSIETSWRVSENDIWQNGNYKQCLETFNTYLKETNTPNAPWNIVNSGDKKAAELQVLEILTSSIDTALQNKSMAVPLLQNTIPLVRMPKLSEVELSHSLEDLEYQRLLKERQKKLKDLHNELYHARIPVVIVYEGWDAAGKGGNIRRVTDALDPRGFDVCPIASPEPHEKNRHYLWRFWTRLPKDGHIAIFDRSWYGRVMVERIEGFCSKNEWQRAYNEINEFERELTNWGAVVIKFWVHIDQETQLERFTSRQKTPEKQWKITDEDWRNREKWSQYEMAVDEMLQKTSTYFAPWHIIESNDKKFARIKSLNIIIREIQNALQRNRK